MKREEVFERLNEIFRNNFDDEGITLSEETSAKDIEDWDSLEQINLVVAIQGAFHVKFNIDEVNAMSNVGEMVDLILRKADA
ncbi:MAG: acyl carrier protein [Hungatella sp.]|nr:acyl carrier protein [Hungatella sp.]MCI9045747.1 acyl carrier protein [Hungatella sp.]